MVYLYDKYKEATKTIQTIESLELFIYGYKKSQEKVDAKYLPRNGEKYGVITLNTRQVHYGEYVYRKYEHVSYDLMMKALDITVYEKELEVQKEYLQSLFK